MTYLKNKDSFFCRRRSNSVQIYLSAKSIYFIKKKTTNIIILNVCIHYKKRTLEIRWIETSETANEYKTIFEHTFLIDLTYMYLWIKKQFTAEIIQFFYISNICVSFVKNKYYFTVNVEVKTKWTSLIRS